MGAAWLGIWISMPRVTASAPTTRTADPPTVVIWLSLDGVRYDQPDRVALTPFERLARDGLRAASLRPVRPSTTFPNHVSQATCASPSRHGIVGNRFRDRTRGRFDYEGDASWLLAEPLWVAAERQGVRAASYFWVGSETAWQGRQASDRMAPFDANVSEQEKVDQILRWLDRPVETRPRLIMSWWHGSDRAGHRYGPESRQVDAALEAQADALQRLLDGLDARSAWPHTTLLVSSDHGMLRANREIDVARALERAGLAAEVDSGGAVAYVHIHTAASQDDERSDALRRARSVLEGLPGHEVLSASEAVASGHWGPLRRIGDFVLLAAPPFYYPKAARGARWLEALRALWDGGRGIHGYDPALSEMHGIFYAMGRGVPAGLEVETVSALDLAPTASHLLGIQPPEDCEGLRLPAIGQSGHASPPAD